MHGIFASRRDDPSSDRCSVRTRAAARDRIARLHCFGVSIADRFQQIEHEAALFPVVKVFLKPTKLPECVADPSPPAANAGKTPLNPMAAAAAAATSSGARAAAEKSRSGAARTHGMALHAIVLQEARRPLALVCALWRHRSGTSPNSSHLSRSFG